MTISGPTLALVLFLALFAGLIALPVAAYLVIGRPWTLKGLALLDRLRIANAVHVPGRTRVDVLVLHG